MATVAVLAMGCRSGDGAQEVNCVLVQVLEPGSPVSPSERDLEVSPVLLHWGGKPGATIGWFYRSEFVARDDVEVARGAEGLLLMSKRYRSTYSLVPEPGGRTLRLRFSTPTCVERKDPRSLCGAYGAARTFDAFLDCRRRLAPDELPRVSNVVPAALP